MRRRRSFRGTCWPGRTSTPALSTARRSVSGPYRFVRWDRGSAIELRADPAYYLGRARIGTIVYKILPDTTTLFDAVRTHDVDAGEIEASFVRQIPPASGIAVVTGPTTGYRHIEYNTTHGALADRNVRLALSYAVDRDAIFRKIYFGIGDRAPGDVLPALGWGDPALRPYPYDPARAARMLDRAGWRAGPGGVRVKDGAPALSFTLSAIRRARSPPRRRRCCCNRCGRASASRSRSRTRRAVSCSRRPDRSCAAPSISDTSAGPVRRTRTTRTASARRRVPPAGTNFSRLADPRVDGLAEASLSTLDVAKRKRLVAELDDAIVARDPLRHDLLDPDDRRVRRFRPRSRLESGGDDFLERHRLALRTVTSRAHPQLKDRGVPVRRARAHGVTPRARVVSPDRLAWSPTPRRFQGNLPCSIRSRPSPVWPA